MEMMDFADWQKVVIEVSAAGMIVLSGIINGEYSCFHLPIVKKDERTCLLLSLRWTMGGMCAGWWVMGEKEHECSRFALFVFTTWLSCDCLCDQSSAAGR